MGKRLNPLEKKILKVSEKFLRHTTGTTDPGYTGTVAYGNVYHMLRNEFPQLKEELASIDEKLQREYQKNRGLISA